MRAPGDCWYRDPEHRPAVGGCPPSCSGPVICSERAGNGEQLLYCEAHGDWRRRTARLPLVRRIRPGEQAGSPSADDTGWMSQGTPVTH